MRVAAPAKLNLRLVLLARESTGYHQLESLFLRLELADLIEVETGGRGIQLTAEGEDVGPAEDNLAHLAAQAFAREVGVPPALRIHLVKRIPAGAGLGGGSSDAAATLLALDELHGRPLPPGALLRVARGLGSDVPFFAARAACALGWGRGDRLLALPAPPVAEVLLLVPGVRISTAEAYASVTLSDPGPVLLHPRDATSWHGIAGIARNDFEAPAAARHSPIADALRFLRAAEPIVAGMTGTGSALYAIFDDVAAADRVAERARSAFTDLLVVRTRTAVDRPATPG